MLDGLLLTAGAYAAALALWAGWGAVRGRAPSRPQTMVALVLQAGLVLHALARLATLAGSARPRELAVAVGYVIASVLVLPLAAGSLLSALEAAAAPAASGWDAAALAVAAAATVVVAVRIHATWP